MRVFFNSNERLCYNYNYIINNFVSAMKQFWCHFMHTIYGIKSVRKPNSEVNV